MKWSCHKFHIFPSPLCFSWHRNRVEWGAKPYRGKITTDQSWIFIVSKSYRSPQILYRDLGFISDTVLGLPLPSWNFMEKTPLHVSMCWERLASLTVLGKFLSELRLKSEIFSVLPAAFWDCAILRVVMKSNQYMKTTYSLDTKQSACLQDNLKATIQGFFYNDFLKFYSMNWSGVF